MNAKAGDAISDKARAAYAKALGGAPIEAVEKTVAQKTAGAGGQWFCIDCGAFPRNNFEAGQHETKFKKHRLAWRSTVTGNVEEP